MCSSRNDLLNEFIQYRTASQRWSHTYQVNLNAFENYCRSNYKGKDELTQDMVSIWLRQRNTESKASCKARTQVVRTLVGYLQERCLTEITLPEPLAAPPNQYLPHAFSVNELSSFFKECDRQVLEATSGKSALHMLTSSVIFRLLYSSGMRTTEARLLKTVDIDLAHGIISINSTKANLQHHVVLHDDTKLMLETYDAIAERIIHGREYFFPARSGGNISGNSLRWMFQKVWRNVSKARAVPYDLRHHYAVTNINLWIDSGFKFYDKFLYLSKSMGHTKLESTKYYYSLVPSLADTIDLQSANGFNEIVPEVSTND